MLRILGVNLVGGDLAYEKVGEATYKTVTVGSQWATKEIYYSTKLQGASRRSGFVGGNMMVFLHFRD